MLTIILFLAGTLASYLSSWWLACRFRKVWFSPILLGTVLLIAVIVLTGHTYTDYEPVKKMLSFGLGPATVALAVPLYKYRDILFSQARVVFLSVAAGALTAFLSAVGLAIAFHMEEKIVRSFASKSVTTPIGIEITRMLGGDPALAAVFIVITGMIASLIGRQILKLVGVEQPIAWGLAMGTAGHGIATAEALRQGHIEGAMAGVAMSLCGVMTAVLVPYLFHLLY